MHGFPPAEEWIVSLTSRYSIGLTPQSASTRAQTNPRSYSQSRKASQQLSSFIMPYVVQPVHPAEAPSLARAMMSAFYEDKHWILLWPNMSQDQIIDGCTQRLPWNLVKKRSNKRHQKVVDKGTGEIVGYARWILPKEFEHIWPEAQVPEPTAEEYELYESRWKAATVNGRSKGSNTAMVVEMSSPLDEAEEKIVQDQPLLCKYLHLSNDR